MESRFQVQRIPLYNREVLHSFKDIEVCDDNGDSIASNILLLSIASQKLGKVVRHLIDSEADVRLILCGYSYMIVQYLDEFVHTGSITLHGQNETDIAGKLERLKNDFWDLGVFLPSEVWTPPIKTIKEEDQQNCSECEGSENTGFPMSVDQEENYSVTIQKVVDSVQNSKLLSENKIGSDGFLLPESFYNFNKDYPRLSKHFCPLCEKTDFKQYLDFKNHMFDFHKQFAHLLPPKYSCRKCNREFGHIRRYYLHIDKLTCSPNESNTRNSAAFIGERIFNDPFNFIHLNENRRGYIYVCPICDKSFDGHSGWTRHIRINHKESVGCLAKRYQCDGCSKMFTAGFYVKHKNSLACSVSGFCELCGKHFNSQSNLQQHMKSTHDHEKVSCDICGKVVRNKLGLKAHMKLQHGDPVPCEKCGRLFKNPGDLRKHIFTMHTEDKDKPYKCSICGQGFGRKGQLNIHERNHRNEKPFRCRYCEYASSSSANRRIHEKQVHKAESRNRPVQLGDRLEPPGVSSKLDSIVTT